MKLYRDLLEAALDQPRPTEALKAASAAVMKAIEHSLVEANSQADGAGDYMHQTHYLG